MYYTCIKHTIIMELSESFQYLVQHRQSDRGYSSQEIPKDVLNRILHAAQLAPSACNSQPWKFIVVDNPELKNKLAATTSNTMLPLNHFTKQAPVHIVIVMEHANFTAGIGSVIKKKHFPLIDIGIAAEHICLAATSEGLGSCMIGWFNEPAVKKLLEIPDKKRPILIITLGYPSKTETRTKKRKDIESIVSYNRY